jgi:hypothetical protein
MLTRKTVILLELESTYGTDPVPVAADDGIYAADVEVEPTGEVLERDYYRDTLSKAAPVIGMKEAQLTFKTEIKGSGAAGTAPKIGKLLQGCGMGQTISAGVSVTYAPQSAETSVKSLTFYVYKDGNLHKITGARGTYVLNLEAGKYGTISWTFKGLYNDVSAAAAPSITMSETTLPPIVYNASFTWGGYAAVASALSIDYGNALSRRESFNAPSGVGSFRIGDRKPQGSFNPEAVVEATHPFWGDWKASTARALGIVIGAQAGNICTISAPKCVSTGVKYSDDEGVAVYDTQFMLAENTSGDDELSIVFT